MGATTGTVWQVWLIDLTGESGPELAYEAATFADAAAFAREWLEEPLGLVPVIWPEGVPLPKP